MKLHTYHDSTYQRLVEDDESANVEVLVQLCRQWPALRIWLCGEFAQNPKVREKFAQVVDGTVTKPAIGARWLAALSDEDHSWKAEKDYLKSKVLAAQSPNYGGLTFNEVGNLLRRYQAGTLDLGAFVLAQEWRKAGAAAPTSPRLARAAASFVDAVVRSDSPRLLRHFGKALLFLKDYQMKVKRRAVLGADWWKLQTLFYVLRHPRESYTTRELKGHLAKIGLEITPKDIRRFCTRHSIIRDMRAGRPRKKRPAFLAK